MIKLHDLTGTETGLEFAVNWDDAEACELPDCDERATHRLIHVPCNWGLILCMEHALLAQKILRPFGWLVQLLFARCKACDKRAHRKEFKVTPIKVES